MVHVERRIVEEAGIEVARLHHAHRALHYFRLVYARAERQVGAERAEAEHGRGEQRED